MRSPIQQYIIDRVREKRQAIGISQEKLSRALGWESQGYISKIESSSESYDDHYNLDHLTDIATLFPWSSREFWPEKPL